MAEKSSLTGTGFGGNRKQARVQVLQQDHVDLPDELRRAVVALHELLARAFRRSVGEAELARQRVLQIEDEAVLAAAGEIVQAHAQRADESFLARDGARLLHRDEAGFREVAPRSAKARGARDPEHRLQVAQAARAFLQVRLEVVRGIVVLEVPLLLLERLRFVEMARLRRERRPRGRSGEKAGASRRRGGARADSS